MDKNLSTNFPKHSAGDIMTVSVPIVSPENTIRTVEEYLLKDVRKLESINYVYVLSKTGLLKGVMSVKEIFRQPKNKIVSEVMVKNLVTAHPYTDRERVAFISLKNNIKAVPVVDKDNKFLGAVLSDTILDAIYQESQEDILHLAGVEQYTKFNIDNISSLSMLVSLKHRLPWLIIGLLGGILAAQIIGLFEHTLSENIILASFIPLVVYMASAVGTQVGFFIIRDLAINPKLNFFIYTIKQFRVIFFIGVVVSILIFIVTLVFYSNISVAFVLALAMFLAILSSIITGLFIPYAFSRLRFDPANASGPIATIIQDLTSVTIYLLVAKWLL
ncbi:magnesium transporter [Patescibacteria group bacterium]|nr:magnesium transporter [Patescibacteria group bacterium]